MSKYDGHTPEPWHIGMKPGPIIYGPLGETIASLVVPMLDHDEHIANVRLMTDAPTLLAQRNALAEALAAIDALATKHEKGAIGKAQKIAREALRKVES